MEMKILHTMLFLLIFLTNASGFGRPRAQKHRRENQQVLRETVIYNPMTDPNATVVDHHCDCGTAGLGVVQKISYLNACPNCGTMQINFSSACIRCGMCTAIASKINDTLLELHEMASTWLNDDEVVLLLRTVCDYAFKDYSLREVDGKRCISGRVAGSTFVPTSADGLWGKNLKDLCHTYLDEIGELQLYRHWQQWCNDYEGSPNLINTLCRNEISTLRDCRRIEDAEQYREPRKTYYAKVKMNMEYGGRK